MSDGQPLTQMAGRFDGGFAVERHQGGGSARHPRDLRTPLVGTDARDLDEVLASVNLLGKPVYVHVSTPPYV
jgi:hypothetical protein